MRSGITTGSTRLSGLPEPHMELQISSDGGSTWSDPRALLPGATSEQHDPQIVVDPVDGKTVYTAFMLGAKASQYVARSDDFGPTWRPMLVEPLERGTDKDILAVRGDDVYLVYNAVKKIYASVSHDGGETWATHKVIANTNSNFGWSLPAAARSTRRATRTSPGPASRQRQAVGPGQPLRHKVDRPAATTWTTSRVDVSEAPPPCAAAVGGPIGARRWR